MTKIFLSHAWNDRDRAQQLAQTLAGSGYVVSFDNVPITADWASSIKRSLEEASKVVVLISPNSVSNANVHFELGVAAALNKPIIMVDTSGDAPSVLSSNWAKSSVVVVDGSKNFEGVADTVAAA